MKIRVEHRPAGYRGWADEDKFKKPSLLPWILIAGFFSLCCASGLFTAGIVLGTNSNQPTEETLEPAFVAAEITMEVIPLTETPTATSTPEPTLEPTATETPPEPTATITEETPTPENTPQPVIYPGTGATGGSGNSAAPKIIYREVIVTSAPVVEYVYVNNEVVNTVIVTPTPETFRIKLKEPPDNAVISTGVFTWKDRKQNKKLYTLTIKNTVTKETIEVTELECCTATVENIETGLYKWWINAGKKKSDRFTFAFMTDLPDTLTAIPTPHTGEVLELPEAAQ